MATLKQVAEAAGVSMKTVSRVINHSPDVTEKTRQRVERAIKVLDYQPNQLARSLASGKTNTVGVLVHHSVDQIFKYPFFNELIGGISACLNQNRTDLLLRFMDDDSSYTELYEQHRVDGLIVTNAPVDHPGVERLCGRNVPCVFTSQITLENNRSNWVDSDFRGAVRQAVEHLLDLGHRRIGLLAGPEHLALSHLRMAGYRQTFSSRGLPIQEDLIVFNDLFMGDGRVKDDLIRYWLRLPEPPTAFIASDDLVAINIINELVSQGYKVPDDFSVVGSDDTLLAHIATPRLTSVHQQAYKKGFTAAETLLKLLSGTLELPVQINLEMELVVRGSTAQAPR